MKTFGLIIPPSKGGQFEANVRRLLADHHRRQFGNEGRGAGPITGEPTAGRHAVAQSAHDGDGGAGQQDRLGAGGARRVLQSSDRGSLIAAMV